MTVDELNAAHATAFRSGGRYIGGEVGAERSWDADGRAFAFKRQPPGLAPLVTERLRERGYPAPLCGRRRAVLGAVVERIGEKGMSVYLAHVAIRQADWSIRHHGDEAGWQTVHYGLQLARAFP
jgi:hypothetical protein